MQSYTQFAQDNFLLIMMTVVSGGMLVWPLFQRAFSSATQVGTVEATRLINQEDAVVLDVREDAEFKGGHIPNSRHIPLGALEARMKELEKFKARPVVISCATGNRAASAFKTLSKAGFEKVVVLDGGLSAWQQANLPVSKK